eukprot:460476-Amorphochlora_amoeboformis.AAC.1
MPCALQSDQKSSTLRQFHRPGFHIVLLDSGNSGAHRFNDKSLFSFLSISADPNRYGSVCTAGGKKHPIHGIGKVGALDHCEYVPDFLCSLLSTGVLRSQGYLTCDMPATKGQKHPQFAIYRIHDLALMYLGPIINDRYLVYIQQNSSFFSEPVMPLRYVKPPSIVLASSLSDTCVNTDPKLHEQGGTGPVSLVKHPSNSLMQSSGISISPHGPLKPKSFDPLVDNKLLDKGSPLAAAMLRSTHKSADVSLAQATLDHHMIIQDPQYLSEFCASVLEAGIAHAMGYVPEVNAASYFHNNKAYLWHCRLGHMPYKRLKYLVKHGKLPGVVIPSSHFDNVPVCHGCYLGRGIRQGWPKKSTQYAANYFGQLVCVDVVGPIEPKSLNNGRYGMVIYDVYSQSKYFKELKDCKSSNLAGAYESWLRYEIIPKNISPTSMTVSHDGATSLRFGEFMRLLQQHGITRKISAPDGHTFHAERAIRSVVERTRQFMTQASIPKQLWNEVMRHSCVVDNFTPRDPTGKTPYELAQGKTPDKLHRLHVPGTRVYVHRGDELKTKKSYRLEEVALPGIYVGYDIYRDLHRVYVPSRKEVYSRREVYFVENMEFSEKNVNLFHELCYQLLAKSGAPIPTETGGYGDFSVEIKDEKYKDIPSDPFYTPTVVVPNNDIPDPTEDTTTPETKENKIRNSDVSEILPNSRTVDHQQVTPANMQEQPPNLGLKPKKIRNSRYPRRNRTKRYLPGMVASDYTNPVHYDTSFSTFTHLRRSFDEYCFPVQETKYGPRMYGSVPLPQGDTKSIRMASAGRYAFVAFERAITECLASDIPTPRSFKHAISGKYGKQWLRAIQNECKNMEKYHVWDIVPNPGKRKLVNTVWVFKVKQLANGKVDKLKARLCIQGFTQIHGVDYWDTFAPVVRYDTMRALLSVSASRDYEIWQGDVPAAYLRAELEEEIYVKPPQGYPVKHGHVLKLNRACYGLKQSAKAWGDALRKFLTSIGYVPSPADPCLYYKETTQGRIYIISFVDDILISAPTKLTGASTLKALSGEFDIKFGEANWFLGMQIIRDRKNKKLKLSQERYLKDVLNRFDMADAKPVKTPYNVSLKFTHSCNELTKEEQHYMSDKPYASVIGSLMYSAISTRPDISATVGVLSRYLSKPRPEHWKAAKHLLRYIAGTTRSGLIFGRSPDDLTLNGWVDASHNDDPMDGRSTSGYVIRFGKDIVKWKSKKQPGIPSRSTAEAEYRAANLYCSELSWIKHLATTFQIPNLDAAIATYEDNQSCIKIAENPFNQGNGKAYHLMYRYLRACVEERVIKLIYVPTQEQLADVFTKGINSADFIKHRESLIFLD